MTEDVARGAAAEPAPWQPAPLRPRLPLDVRRRLVRQLYHEWLLAPGADADAATEREP